MFLFISEATPIHSDQFALKALSYWKDMVVFIIPAWWISWGIIMIRSRSNWLESGAPSSYCTYALSESNFNKIYILYMLYMFIKLQDDQQVEERTINVRIYMKHAYPKLLSFSVICRLLFSLFVLPWALYFFISRMLATIMLIWTAVTYLSPRVLPLTPI